MGHWLLVRRSIAKPEELAYYMVFGPVETTLSKAVQVAGTRWAVEETIETSNGEVGLDQYEVRHWIPWYRYITLAMLAHAYLCMVRAYAAEKGEPPALLCSVIDPAVWEELLPLTVPEVRRLLRLVIGTREVTLNDRLAWSRWRRRHQARQTLPLSPPFGSPPIGCGNGSRNLSLQGTRYCRSALPRSGCYSC
jgi:hypothetical protein